MKKTKDENIILQHVFLYIINLQKNIYKDKATIFIIRKAIFSSLEIYLEDIFPENLP